ncbi:hypothetical protein ILUMI_21161 [Ignelater luminosus]|uniref:MADF domain-containing protein n=1 Tax=Ignelater luminosus TaxID=2038154 RepID=A0A8K0FY92_IGNLU|nr:hypothetical protein ILUMI_21161 [Ignelater luminosus]
MSWSKQQVKLLINEYKKLACLYAVKSLYYKNKHARNSAVTAIQKALTEIKQKVTVDEIKAKFHGLKNTFLTEYRKHLKSLKTRTGEDKVSSILQINVLPFATIRCFYKTQHTSIFIGIANPTRQKRAGASASEPKSKKRKYVEKTPEQQAVEDVAVALKQISAAIATSSESTEKPRENHHDIFGRFVASKLQEIDPGAAKEMEKQIVGLLYSL